MTKFLILAALVAVAQAGYIAQPLVAKYAQPIAVAKYASIDADYDPNPQYSFAYDVQDQLTGDSKNQQETRNGDVVQGTYSLVDSDGYRRIVDYTADPHNGFNAVVRREPLGHAIKVAPVAKVYAAPVAKIVSPVAKIVSPYGYAAPQVYAAPQAYYH